MNRPILCISHGPMAEGMLASASMLCDTSHVQAEGLYEQDHPQAFQERIRKHLLKEPRTLILCDLFGGTPCNCALALSQEFHEMILVAGMNLPLLLEAMLSDQNLKDVIAVGQQACQSVRLVQWNQQDALDKEMDG